MELVDYRPSQTVLNKWLSTRKPMHKHQYGGVKLDGLFSISGYANDRKFFILSMIGELIGIIAMLIFSGSNIFFIGGMFFLVLLDIGSAYILHKRRGEICKTENNLKLLQLEQVFEPLRTSNIDDKIKAFANDKNKLENWFWSKFAKGIIWFICFVKIFGIVIVLSGFNTWVLVLSAIYIGVALVHIYYTGYYFSGKTFYHDLEKEKNRFLVETKNNDGNVGYGINVSNPVLRFDEISCEVSIDIKEKIIIDIENSQPNIFLNSYMKDRTPKEHSIFYNTGNGKFILKTWGVIDDDCLFKLSSGGDSQNQISEELSKSLIAYLGLRMQLEKYLPSGQK